MDLLDTAEQDEPLPILEIEQAEWATIFIPSPDLFEVLAITPTVSTRNDASVRIAVSEVDPILFDLYHVSEAVGHG